MSKSETQNLLPNGKELIEKGKNVLLIGDHGTGKTHTVRALAEECDMSMVAYSCATLDPFTDLVGVPVPVTKKVVAPGQEGVGLNAVQHVEKQVLTMVRPDRIDNAEIIFFDELNRARPETQDAVLEIINNGTINGEPLPRLKACWAAMNPPNSDKGYNVDNLDPALMDRFDQYLDFSPRPSIQWMNEHGGIPLAIATAVKKWWDANQAKENTGYISPRRLHKIALAYMDLGTKTDVKQSLPPGEKYDLNKLWTELRIADGKMKAPDTNSMGGPMPLEDHVYGTYGTALKNKDDLAEALRENDKNINFHNKVANVAAGWRAGPQSLLKDMEIVFEAMNGASLERMFSETPGIKNSQWRKAILELKADANRKMSDDNINKIISGINSITKQSTKKIDLV